MSQRTASFFGKVWGWGPEGASRRRAGPWRLQGRQAPVASKVAAGSSIS